VPTHSRTHAAHAAGIGQARHRLYALVLDGASRLPLRLGFGVARLAGRLRHRLLLGSLRVNPDAARSLERTPREIRTVARRAAELRASSELEDRLCPRLGKPVLGRLVRIRGLENLEGALEHGKGAVLFSVHVWSADTLFAALAELGHAPTVVGYGPRTGFLPFDRELRLRQVRQMERRFGYRYLWMGEDPFIAVRAAGVLRANGIVVMFVDLPGQGAAVDVDLLGGRTRFASGPALLSQATGAPLLDFYLRRAETWAPVIAEIGTPLVAAGALEDAVESCAKKMDAHVRRDPAQWTFFSSRDGSDALDAAAPR
jgi:lauroyl/myristoyl acyltransferase